jgi:hypothetical protein
MKIALIVLGIFAAINALVIVMPRRCFRSPEKGKDAGEPSKEDR